jgi:hypothetical protein
MKENTNSSSKEKLFEKTSESKSFLIAELLVSKEIEENELRFKLKLLTEEQKNAFLKEKEEIEKR